MIPWAEILQRLVTNIHNFKNIFHSMDCHAESTRVVNVVPPFYKLKSSTCYYKPAEVVRVMYSFFGCSLLEKHSYSNIYCNNVMNYLKKYFSFRHIKIESANTYNKLMTSSNVIIDMSL